MGTQSTAKFKKYIWKRFLCWWTNLLVLNFSANSLLRSFSSKLLLIKLLLSDIVINLRSRTAVIVWKSPLENASEKVHLHFSCRFLQCNFPEKRLSESHFLELLSKLHFSCFVLSLIWIYLELRLRPITISVVLTAQLLD